MVKASDVSTMADSWSESFEKNRVLPPLSQTARLAVDNHLTQSRGFQLSFSRVTAAHLPQETQDVEQHLTYQLRLTLFDESHQHFFGRTWKSRPQKIKNNTIIFNEALYFHTSLRLPCNVVVVELVSLTSRPDGSQQALGLGFTILELFSNKTEAQGANGDRRLNLHLGSPRVLLHPLLKDTVDYGIFLKTVDGAHLDCAVKKHPALTSVMHLLPENVFVSGDEDIPGLCASPTGDSLLRPQLLKMLPFSLSRLTISLQPSLEKFESQLLQLISADCHNTKQLGSDGAPKTVVIQERRLHVGVHNGWCFLEKPQVVVLEAVETGVRGRTDSTSKLSTPSKDSSTTLSLPQTLSLRSSLELRLINHLAVAIVFQLEYVFSAPIGRETMLSTTSSSRAAFLQCLRWGIFCPFQSPAQWKGEEIQLVLRGGAKPNPYGVMVYSTETFAKSHASVPLSAAGTAQPASETHETITFRLTSSLNRKLSSPKASLRARQEDMSFEKSSPSSPSDGRRHILRASPPDSPPGPMLSLSQLAATSRYPTISHSSSVLLWQQSFPSPLHPSPLASAHQLSHVAFPAVSNIAHLEIDLQRKGDVSSLSHMEGDQIKALPFTPVHAPVITPGMNVPRPSSSSSRNSLAHLHSAGFPEIYSRSGDIAEVLEPTEPMSFDPQLEEKDPLQSNLLVFQFLAFTRTPETGFGPDWPDKIHFTFQFYRFPPVTSQQLKLLTSDRVQHNSVGAVPCVLTSITKHGTINPDSPGLQVQFRVDDGFLKPGERRWFLRYLALHSLHIDVWDSNSLLLIGSTAVELKYMLRQGKPAVQALHEVEVLTTDYVGEDIPLPSTSVGHKSASSPVTVHTIIRGRLHVRTGNIGYPVDSSRRTAADLTPSHSNIITPCKITSGFKGGSLASTNILQLNATNMTERMPLYSSLSESDDRLTVWNHRDIIDRVKTKEAHLAMGPLHSKYHRECSKAESIANMLSQAITTQHLLYASLGSAEYMEFVLKNPFNVPHTVTIHSEDPELSVITNTEEWSYFKALTKSQTVIEGNMFHREEDSSGPRVYLRPKESVHIPLKYQSFHCDHTTALQGPGFIPTGSGSQMAKKNLSNIIAAKSIKVTFITEDGKPMAICQVNVEPSPHVVDQTFRLYHPEHCFLKKAIRLPPWHYPTCGPDEEPDPQPYISVCCSDPNVICQSKMLVPGEPQDVYLKVPGSPSPHVKMFFVMVFTDKWMAVPSQTWQMYVHFLERVDVSCVTGQRTCQPLVLRGKQSTRKIQCFSSHPQEIQVISSSHYVNTLSCLPVHLLFLTFSHSFFSLSLFIFS
ncbi:nephrocystin-4 isoform X2 [Cynoglossus semilaevis]|uniref:nephrocystin-4 isoform X2 n=1 Tax=Cynoglossus semilaevis TaxID=244447 RepID=UPI0007DC96EB|nr:nephrocystin-4 isoform X2 [Cynoglossus semilaevis]